MHLLRKLVVAFYCLLQGTTTLCQKQMLLNESFRQEAIEFDPKPQKHKGPVEMSAYSFGRYQIISLKNDWEKNSFWTLYLKEKNIRRVTVNRRSGYSFQLVEQQKVSSDSSSRSDTANVVVLFEKTTPDGFVITNSSVPEKLITGSEVISAFIQSSKGTATWQAAFFERPGKGFTTDWIVSVFADTLNITTAAVNLWENGKKPLITGPFGLGTAFYIEGKQVGAIQYPGLGQPKIWISKSLTDEHQFLLAALMEVLLLISTDVTEK